MRGSAACTSLSYYYHLNGSFDWVNVGVFWCCTRARDHWFAVHWQTLWSKRNKSKKWEMIEIAANERWWRQLSALYMQRKHYYFRCHKNSFVLIKMKSQTNYIHFLPHDRQTINPFDRLDDFRVFVQRQQPMTYNFYHFVPSISHFFFSNLYFVPSFNSYFYDSFSIQFLSKSKYISFRILVDGEMSKLMMN